jgi:hypothetical protein
MIRVDGSSSNIVYEHIRLEAGKQMKHGFLEKNFSNGQWVGLLGFMGYDL